MSVTWTAYNVINSMMELFKNDEGYWLNIKNQNGILSIKLIEPTGPISKNCLVTEYLNNKPIPDKVTEQQLPPSEIPPPPLPLLSKCRIIDTKHSGVHPNTIGIIQSVETDGYAVEVEQHYTCNFGGKDMSRKATLFYFKNEVELLA